MNIIEKIRIKLNIEHWKVIAFFLCIYDALTVNVSYFFAIWLRHDFQYRTIPSYYLFAWVKLIIPYAVITILIYLLCGIYRSIWRFASYNELIRCVEAVALDVIIYSIDDFQTSCSDCCRIVFHGDYLYSSVCQTVAV